MEAGADMIFETGLCEKNQLIYETARERESETGCGLKHVSGSNWRRF